jgi:hypothetical protein
MRFFLVVIFICLSSSALAASNEQNFVSLALTRTEDRSVTEGEKGADDVTVINATLGFGMGSGLVLGGKYFDYSQDNEFLDDSNTSISGWGPLVGYYHQSGFFGSATYLVQPTKDYKTASGGKGSFYGGHGYVVEAGKSFPISGSFAAGVQVTQSHVEYQKVKGDGGEDDLEKEWSDTSLYPYLTLFVYF